MSINSNENEKINFLIYGIVAQNKCENIRKDFVFSRSFLVSKIYDPSFVENKAESLINCYHNTILNINKDEKCIDLKDNLAKCLGKNPNKIPKHCTTIIKSMYDNC